MQEAEHRGMAARCLTWSDSQTDSQQEQTGEPGRMGVNPKIQGKLASGSEISVASA